MSEALSARVLPVHKLHPTFHWPWLTYLSCHQPCSGLGCGLPSGFPQHWYSSQHFCDCQDLARTPCDLGWLLPVAQFCLALPDSVSIFKTSPILWILKLTFLSCSDSCLSAWSNHSSSLQRSPSSCLQLLLLQSEQVVPGLTLPDLTASL